MWNSKEKNWDNAGASAEWYGAILNGTSSKIMVVDNDCRIVFINNAAIEYLSSLEGKIQKQLPAFKFASLIGTCIDAFHTEPSVQRNILAELTQSFLTSISISGQVFDLRAFPLHDRNGTRIGSAAEWSDPVQMDNAGEITAIRRTQAIIEYDLAGTILKANDRYLNMMGYQLPEIQGKKHSMFMDSQDVDSSQYRQFWEALSRGEFASGKYRRIDSRGKKIWVQSSFNPISDLRNRPFKVVEYSSEITTQVELVKTVQGLISEMKGATEKARVESASVSSAAFQTLTNVTAASAGAAEMKDSVRDISQSMLHSSEAVIGVTGRAASAAASTNKLATTTRNMSGIVEMIQSIAAKINMLALNATIEAARSGEAGRGFAVVAAEVKVLARQAADATKLINSEIATVQRMTTDVAQAMTEINSEIKNIQNYVSSTATAVEQQSATSRTMSTNMASAASMVQGISVNVNQINDAIQKISEAAAQTETISLSIT